MPCSGLEIRGVWFLFLGVNAGAGKFLGIGVGVRRAVVCEYVRTVHPVVVVLWHCGLVDNLVSRRRHCRRV